MTLAWNAIFPLPALLQAGSTAASNLTRVNSVALQRRFGQAWIIKSRNGPGKPLTSLSNLYFRLARIPIRYWCDARCWQRWETACFRMLNGDAFRAFPVGAQTVCATKLPGRALFDHLKSGTLNPRMLRAAGREFRRAHSFWSEYFNGPWSHGDAGMPNVIYDPRTDRARLIDFEIVHLPTMDAAARHADDLSVFLLDLIALGPRERWLVWALEFISAYDATPQVLSELSDRLTMPKGLARIWWNVRTSWTPRGKMQRRIARLRAALRALSPEHHSSDASNRPIAAAVASK